MPAPSKRSRQPSNPVDQPEASTSTAPNPPSTPVPLTRRRTTSLQDIQDSAPAHTTPTPPRPILTRSAATQLLPSIRNALTRSNSLFTPSTRRSANGNASGFGFGSGLPSPSPSSSSGRGGTLTRTQSTPSLSTSSPSSLKSLLSAGSGGFGRGKGEDEPDFEGGFRFGRGKENVPPKKDEENDDGARKRLRLTRRPSAANTRGRSGSVSSMRSDGLGRMASVAPSTSSSFSLRTSRFPSPSPSVSSATTFSLDSVSVAPSADPLDVLDEDVGMDVDRTPTKPKRVMPRRTVTLPTPPPSSPMVEVSDVDAAAERMGLVRMKSDVTIEHTAGSPFDTELASETETDGSYSSPTRQLNPYKQLKAHLRLSTTTASQTIVGREEEKSFLRTYLLSPTATDVGMYVSGPPGTGKTATVTLVSREMVSVGWEVVEMGCMGLKITDMWRKLGEQLGCGKTEREVQEYLEHTTTRTLVILDEIDSLLPPAPAVATPATSHLLSKIFSLPSKNAGRVKLVAISNTLDLTLRARLILPDNATPLVLPFKAYVGENMVDIISSRLTFAGSDEQGSGVKVDNKALVLLSRKVEAQNGDLRMYLGVISSAVTLAEMEWVKKGGNAGSKIPLTKVSLQHMIKALTNHIQQLKASAGSASTGTTTVTGKKIKSVPLQGKMVLMAILVFVSRVKAGLPGSPAQNSGSNTPVSASRTSELLTTSTLYAAYSHLLSHTSSPFPPSPESDYRDLLSNLEVLGLISLASGSNSSTMSRTGSGMSSRWGNASTAGQKIELNVRDDEIKEGLGIDGAGGKGLAEEEVAKIWEREESRIVRAKEKLSKALEAKAAEDI